MPDRLAQALRRRIGIIGDHAWRDRDAAGHLDALRRVSDGMDALVAEAGGSLPPRLAHFLERRSYEKALAFIETGEAPHEHHAH